MNINLNKQLNKSISSNISSLLNRGNEHNIDLKQLVVGQTFSGQILDIQNKEIQIIMANNQILHAKLIDMLNINIGDNITFEVKENNSSQIIIKPIDTESVSNSIITKALNNANIAKSDINTEVVRQLINHDMPIDKQTIHQMLKIIKSFPEVEIKQLVFMQKQGIEINHANINQLNQYIKGDYQLTKQLEVLSDYIIDHGIDLVEKNLTKQAVNLYQQLNEIFSSSKQDTPINLSSQHKNELILLINNLIKPNVEIINLRNTPEVQINPQITLNEGVKPSIVEWEKNSQEIDNIVSELKEIINKPNLTIFEVNKVIDKIFQKLFTYNTLNENGLKDILSSKVFKTIVKEQIFSPLLIDPNKFNYELDKQEYVKKVYNTIEEHIDKLSKLIIQPDKENTYFSNSIQNIKSNLNFLQNINQVTPYVQLPLKLHKDRAHGDLYIYNRKPKNAIDNESYTAFLHLDLENLGATDIDIKMQGKKVNTRFTLQTKESMDIVESNLPILKARLEKRGYLVEYSVTLTKEIQSNNIINNLFGSLSQEKAVKRYTFDVRM